MSDKLRIALAQFDFPVGAVARNANRISGMIIGRFTGYEEDDQMYEPLIESISHAVEEYTFPVCFHFPVGHTPLNFPLIMGEAARLNVNSEHVFLNQ